VRVFHPDQALPKDVRRSLIGAGQPGLEIGTVVALRSGNFALVFEIAQGFVIGAEGIDVCSETSQDAR
jgi:hypothetical protein